MRIEAHAGDEHATSVGMARYPRTGALSVPFANISTIQSIATGFRQEMFDITDEEGDRVGGVETGAGWGSDFITLNWGDHHAVIRGIDLLRAWVRTFDPEGAKAIPSGLGRRRPKRKVKP